MPTLRLVVALLIAFGVIASSGKAQIQVRVMRDNGTYADVLAVPAASGTPLALDTATLAAAAQRTDFAGATVTGATLKMAA